MFRFKSSVLAVAVALAAVSFVPQSSALWTEYSLPDLPGAFAPTAFGFQPDGRYVFATQGAYYQQDTFGAGSYTAYSNTAPGNTADPSFIAVWDATHAVAGGGGFGASDFYRFDPSALTAPTFTAQGLSIQNYSGVFRDTDSLYVGGGNGSIDNGFGGGRHSISYVELSSSTSKVIIDNISVFSCDFARDAAGNLYIGDNDDQKVYFFTAAQLDLAIAGTPLAIADGTLLFQSANSLGSMAVDGLGRVWSSGFFMNGLQMYDPGTDTETTVIPGLNNSNYKVYTFAANGQDYVAYLNQANPFQPDTEQYYGFQAIPEPTAVGLTLAGLSVFAACRRQRSR